MNSPQDTKLSQNLKEVIILNKLVNSVNNFPSVCENDKPKVIFLKPNVEIGENSKPNAITDKNDNMDTQAKTQLSEVITVESAAIGDANVTKKPLDSGKVEKKDSALIDLTSMESNSFKLNPKLVQMGKTANGRAVKIIKIPVDQHFSATKIPNQIVSDKLLKTDIKMAIIKINPIENEFGSARSEVVNNELLKNPQVEDGDNLKSGRDEHKDIKSLTKSLIESSAKCNFDKQTADGITLNHDSKIGVEMEDSAIADRSNVAAPENEPNALNPVKKIKYDNEYADEIDQQKENFEKQHPESVRKLMRKNTHTNESEKKIIRRQRLLNALINDEMPVLPQLNFVPNENHKKKDVVEHFENGKKAMTLQEIKCFVDNALLSIRYMKILKLSKLWNRARCEAMKKFVGNLVHICKLVDKIKRRVRILAKKGFVIDIPECLVEFGIFEPTCSKALNTIQWRETLPKFLTFFEYYSEISNFENAMKDDGIVLTFPDSWISEKREICKALETEWSPDEMPSKDELPMEKMSLEVMLPQKLSPIVLPKVEENVVPTTMLKILADIATNILLNESPNMLQIVPRKLSPLKKAGGKISQSTPLKLQSNPYAKSYQKSRPRKFPETRENVDSILKVVKQPKLEIVQKSNDSKIVSTTTELPQKVTGITKKLKFDENHKPSTSRRNTSIKMAEKNNLRPRTKRGHNYGRRYGTLVIGTTTAKGTIPSKYVNIERPIVKFIDGDKTLKSINEPILSADGKTIVNLRFGETDKCDTVILGANGTTVSKTALNKTNWLQSGAAITRKVLLLVFDRNTLAFHTLTGKPSPAFLDMNKPLKNQLDAAKVADIMEFMLQQLPMFPKDVRAAITTKCADENKMFRQREKKRLQLENAHKSGSKTVLKPNPKKKFRYGNR